MPGLVRCDPALYDCNQLSRQHVFRFENEVGRFPVEGSALFHDVLNFILQRQSGEGRAACPGVGVAQHSFVGRFRGSLEPDNQKMLFQEMAVAGVHYDSSAGRDNQALLLRKLFQELRFGIAKGSPAFRPDPLVDALAECSHQPLVHVNEGKVQLPGQKPSHQALARCTKADERDIGFFFHYGSP